MTEEEPAEVDAESKAARPWWVRHRWVFPLILFVSLLLLAWATGLLENVDPEKFARW